MHEHNWRLGFIGKIDENSIGNYHCVDCDDWRKEDMGKTPKKEDVLVMINGHKYIK